MTAPGGVQAKHPGPRGLGRRMRLQIPSRRRSVPLACAVAVGVASVNHSAMTRDEQSDMHAPCAERTLDAPAPHRRMHRCADLAEEMRATGLWIESRSRLPVQP